MRDAAWTCLRLARVVLEARTPLSLTTGQGSRLLDTDLVRDAWGLPAIPATGLKGVLRSLWRETYGPEQETALFGYIDGTEGAPARIALSWGVVHGSDDRPAPVAAPDCEDDLALDDLLRQLRRLAASDPLVRQRVALGPSCVADAGERAQFDRSVVPAGTRFTVEVAFWGDAGQADEALYRRALALFHDPLLRVGGATRAGLGALAPVGHVQVARFDMADPNDAARYRALRPALARFEDPGKHALASPFAAVDPPLAPARTVEHVALRLEAEDLWRFGGGELGLLPDREIDAKARVLTETVVVWDGGTGRLGARRVVVPASAVKGALRHRTLFHTYRLKGRFAADTAVEAAVESLFGAIREGRDADTLAGARGRVVIDDVFLEGVEGFALTHNAVDRFTGGVRAGLLFDEELAGPTAFTLSIRIEPPRPGEDDRDVARAFTLALDDLRRGWLPLGGATRAGHGVFRAAEDPAC